jgi:hypothetical protein
MKKLLACLVLASCASMFATALITPKLGNMLGGGLLLAPWRLALGWLAWASGLLLSSLCWMGVTPAGFVPQAKVGCPPPAALPPPAARQLACRQPPI